MNNSIDSQPFASRTALPPGASSFAGQRRLRKLLMTLGGTTTTNSVSVVGPRQSGRSSLLQQLSHPEFLTQPALKEAVVVQASFREHKGEPQGAIRYLIQRIADTLAQRGLPHHAVADAGSMVVAVKHALAVCPGRLIIVIDDFEAVGSDLRRDHQTDLRQAVYNETRVGYVIASRLPLARCLQEWRDELSDLAPLLNEMQELLEPLSRREIQEMVQRAAGFPADSRQPELVARFVHERVGGYALWVQQALAVLAEEDELKNEKLGQLGTWEKLEFRLMQRLRQDWSSSYRRLSSSARHVLDQPVKAAEWILHELQMAGWAAPGTKEFRPAGLLLSHWLQARSREADTPTAPREEDAYDKLVQVVDSLNTRYQRLTGHNDHIIRPDVFTTAQDVPFLRRTINSPEDFGRLVLSLARLLNDGTGGATKGPRRLPELCYEHPDCIVRQVMTLRNAWVHVVRPETQQPERNLQAEAAVYMSYLGTADPRTPEHFQQLADALRQETIRFIGELIPVFPFSKDLAVELLFSRNTAA